MSLKCSSLQLSIYTSVCVLMGYVSLGQEKLRYSDRPFLPLLTESGLERGWGLGVGIALFFVSLLTRTK